MCIVYGNEESIRKIERILVEIMKDVRGRILSCNGVQV
jgi:hypothetical protein